MIHERITTDAEIFGISFGSLDEPNSGLIQDLLRVLVLARTNSKGVCKVGTLKQDMYVEKGFVPLGYEEDEETDTIPPITQKEKDKEVRRFRNLGFAIVPKGSLIHGTNCGEQNEYWSDSHENIGGKADWAKNNVKDILLCDEPTIIAPVFTSEELDEIVLNSYSEKNGTLIRRIIGEIRILQNKLGGNNVVGKLKHDVYLPNAYFHFTRKSGPFTKEQRDKEVQKYNDGFEVIPAGTELYCDDAGTVYESWQDADENIYIYADWAQANLTDVQEDKDAE